MLIQAKRAIAASVDSHRLYPPLLPSPLSCLVGLGADFVVTSHVPVEGQS